MGTKGYLLARGCSDCCKFYCNADAAATDPTNVASAATLPPATGTTPGAEGPETQLSVSTLTFAYLSALLLVLTAAGYGCIRLLGRVGPRELLGAACFSR